MYNLHSYRISWARASEDILLINYTNSSSVPIFKCFSYYQYIIVLKIRKLFFLENKWPKGECPSTKQWKHNYNKMNPFYFTKNYQEPRRTELTFFRLKKNSMLKLHHKKHPRFFPWEATGKLCMLWILSLKWKNMANLSKTIVSPKGLVLPLCSYNFHVVLCIPYSWINYNIIAY